MSRRGNGMTGLSVVRTLLLLAMFSSSSLLGITMALPVHAVVEPDEVMADPVLESRARHLSKELRCLVCQNQSIDDSNAELAQDLRRIVREQLLAGDTDQEVIAFITARYGDFVLLRPPIKPSTWGLWYGPLGILIVASLGLVVFLRRQRHESATGQVDPLNADEQAKLNEILAGGEAAEKS
jgi:cytochrome c-type biogenesis protein CcmH